ncbi:DNA-formamidopyrimidine glycosylase [Acaryochloris thomasi]|nr:DNA-formamidopyrimidine glycosylase [Acaryochloris thomasi]
MPELPEVETVRRGLDQRTCGHPLLGAQVLYPRTIAYPSPAEFEVGIQNMHLKAWQRRGKYLLGQLTSQAQPAGWLGVHLRMTGQLLWLRRDDALQKHTRVRLFFADQQELRFVDQRTFGQMWWVAPGTAPETVISGLQRLGPEPLSVDFSVPYLEQQLSGRRRSIKSALLDQSIVAGLGNIYADESLFVSGILPTTLCLKLTAQQVERLHAAIVQVLSASLEQGGTTFSDFRDVLGINGNYGGVAWVYGRAGQPCRSCGTLLDRMKLAGRSTHFCRQCQV